MQSLFSNKIYLFFFSCVGCFFSHGGGSNKRTNGTKIKIDPQLLYIIHSEVYLKMQFRLNMICERIDHTKLTNSYQKRCPFGGPSFQRPQNSLVIWLLHLIWNDQANCINIQPFSLCFAKPYKPFENDFWTEVRKKKRTTGHKSGNEDASLTEIKISFAAFLWSV